MTRAGIFLDLGTPSPVPSEMDVAVAVDRLRSRVLARDEGLEVTAVYAFGYAEDDSTMQMMGALQEVGVTCCPVFHKRNGDEVSYKIIMEMGKFVRDNPGCTLVLASDDVGFVQIVHGFNCMGIRQVLVVKDEKHTSKLLKRCATEVWEWEAIYQEPQGGPGHSGAGSSQN